MGRHSELSKEFKTIMESGFDWNNQEHRDSVSKLHSIDGIFSITFKVKWNKESHWL